MIGKNLAEAGPDEFFNRAVGDCHHVDVAFIFRLYTLSEELAQARTSFARNLRSLRNPYPALCVGPSTAHEAAPSSIVVRDPRRRPDSVMVWIWCL